MIIQAESAIESKIDSCHATSVLYAKEVPGTWYVISGARASSLSSGSKSRPPNLLHLHLLQIFTTESSLRV
jgi:hypothetical protein